MGAAGPYRMDNNPIYPITKEATDHRQITLLEAEWNDIKRFSTCIKIEKPKIDWFSLLLGAAASTLISFFYSVIIFINNNQKDAIEMIFYASATILLTGISLYLSFNNKDKEDSFSISIVQLDNLCVKIEEIDNRVRMEPFGR